MFCFRPVLCRGIVGAVFIRTPGPTSHQRNVCNDFDSPRTFRSARSYSFYNLSLSRRFVNVSRFNRSIRVSTSLYCFPTCNVLLSYILYGWSQPHSFSSLKIRNGEFYHAGQMQAYEQIVAARMRTLISRLPISFICVLRYLLAFLVQVTSTFLLVLRLCFVFSMFWCISRFSGVSSLGEAHLSFTITAG